MQTPEQIVSALQTGYVSVTVAFYLAREDCFGDQEYTYKALASLNLQPEDLVVVPAKNHYQVVRVISVDPSPALDYNKVSSYKWIVQKVDLASHTNILEKENILIQNIQILQRKATRDQYLNDLKEQLGSDFGQLKEQANMQIIHQDQDQEEVQPQNGE